MALRLSVAELTESVVRNLNRIHPVSTAVQGLYGIAEDVYLSLPCVLNGGGVASVVRVSLSPDEAARLRASGGALWDILKELRDL